MYLLYLQLGLSSLVALASIILVIPIQGFVANWGGKLMKKALHSTDERAKFEGELVSGMTSSSCENRKITWRLSPSAILVCLVRRDRSCKVQCLGATLAEQNYVCEDGGIEGSLEVVCAWGIQRLHDVIHSCDRFCTHVCRVHPSVGECPHCSKGLHVNHTLFSLEVSTLPGTPLCRNEPHSNSIASTVEMSCRMQLYQAILC